MTSEEAFAERLMDALPELRPRYDELSPQDIDDAAYLLVDAHTRELVARYQQDQSGTTPALSRLAEFLEGEVGRDPDLDSLISSAFVALMSDRPPTPDPAALLGPTLRAEVDKNRSWRAKPADAALVARLVAGVPALASLAAENAFGDHGDVLTHMFLADLADREATHVEENDLDEPRKVLALLENEFQASAGDHADEAIASGFVESLPYPGEPGAGLVDLLGPKLRAELLRQRRDIS